MYTLLVILCAGFLHGTLHPLLKDALNPGGLFYKVKTLWASALCKLFHPCTPSENMAPWARRLWYHTSALQCAPLVYKPTGGCAACTGFWLALILSPLYLNLADVAIPGLFTSLLAFLLIGAVSYAIAKQLDKN